MTLVDPTSGAGYAFGAQLPSTHMTTIATQQPDAVDGVGGGSYAADLTFSGEIDFTDTVNLTNEPEFASTKMYTFCQPISAAEPAVEPAVDDQWVLVSSADGYSGIWQQQLIGYTPSLYIPIINLPFYSELKTVSCYIDGGNAHSDVPETPPSLTVYSRLISTGAATSIGTVSDDPDNESDYELYHILGPSGGATPLTLTGTAAARTNDGTRAFYALATGENGSFAVNDQLMVIALTVSVDCTAIYPG